MKKDRALIFNEDSKPYIIAFLSGIGIIVGSIYLPLYAHELGADEIMVGLIVGAHSITYIFMPFLIGRFSDRISSKRTLIYGTIILGSLYAIYSIVSSPIFLIPLKALEGLGWSFIWPSLQSYFGGFQKKLKVYNLMWSSGVVIGPYAGAVIVQDYNFQYVFALVAILFAISSILGVLLHPNIKNEGKVENSPSEDSVKFNLMELPLFLFPVMYGFALTLIFTFFPIYAVIRGIAVIEMGYILVLSNIGRVLAFIIPGDFQNAFGSQRRLLLLVFAVGIIPTLIVFYDQVIVLYFDLFFYGIVSGLLFTSMQYKILHLSEERRGFYAGLLESTMGVGSLVAPFLGGIVASVNSSYVFLLPMSVALVVIGGNIVGHRN